MFLPHHNIVIVQFLQGGVGQLHGTWQSVRDDSQSARTEGLCLRNHAPEEIGQHVFLEKGGIVRHGDQFDGMRMKRSFVRRTLLDQIIVNTQMRWQFGSGSDRFVCNDDIRSAVVEDTDDGTVLHRPACQVAHAAVGAFAEEIATLQMRQCGTDRFDGRDGRHTANLVVHPFGDVDGDVTAIPFCPTFLPEITGHFCYFVYFCRQLRTTIQY